VNSVCHFLGRRRWNTPDESRNVGWLALVSLGESWHHNHHAFPRSAYHGLRWYEVDIAALVIRALATVGLARDVVTVDPQRQRERRQRVDRVDAEVLTTAQRGAAADGVPDV
jgi:stearoyl-CoA desaturase (delta-9 desaturase)